VRFSTEADPLMAELEHPTKERIDRAKDYVAKLKPTGGTAIDDALAAALKFRQHDKRPFMIVFLTDGAPTVGVTNEDDIVKRATDRAADVRIFCFGIGNDVNTHLLDRIADATRAASQYVTPKEDLEVKLSSFYDKIKEPVMTDVKVAFAGSDIKASQLYPARLPDLFKGDTLLLFGRYSGAGAGSVKISGAIDGKEREFVEDVKLDARDDHEDRQFIASLWATRRVGWLLDEIRMHGENAELKDEVVKLAREHGIVTPYTAYLIIEDEQRRNVPALSRSFEDLSRDGVAANKAKVAYDSTLAEAKAPAQRQGEQAVTNAQVYGGLKYAGNVQQQKQMAGSAVAIAPPPVAAPAVIGAAGVASATQPAATDLASVGYRYAQNYNQQVKVVAGRAFYQNGNRWSDSTAQSRKDLKQKTIKFNSDEYFALARRDARAAQWLSLGNNIDVLIEDTLYQIRDE
jgi:Ca-activated chloride channel family protein